METINSQEVYAYKSELKLGKLVSLMNICKALGLFGFQLLVTEIFSFIPLFCPDLHISLNFIFPTVVQVRCNCFCQKIKKFELFWRT